MENNANEAHIFWKSQDQQTEVWMKQVSGKTPEEKKEQSRSGYRLLAEMIKTRYAYDLEKETDSVMRTETGKPYLRLHPELFFNISHSGEWIACVLGNVPVGKLFTQADTEKEKKNILFQIWTKKESYLKFTGDGIRRELCEISYEGCRFYRLVMPEGYSGMICVEN